MKQYMFALSAWTNLRFALLHTISLCMEIANSIAECSRKGARASESLCGFRITHRFSLAVRKKMRQDASGNTESNALYTHVVEAMINPHLWSRKMLHYTGSKHDATKRQLKLMAQTMQPVNQCDWRVSLTNEPITIE